MEMAPTTVSLMVSELSRPGVLQRTADPADHRRIVSIAPDYAAPIGARLSAVPSPANASCAASPPRNVPRSSPPCTPTKPPGSGDRHRDPNA
ncbi:hypothetical protein M3765_01935 [Streptomyces thermoviolaceus]|uniref:hypothetical protein n=1 Tax=Streptomyces thermoviolaceus TaxID=1952 RepID=UPI001E2F1107|nr:hypothetical protein [Streptomyces thermoviolaceus]MCM3262817.1 hypothetical protein [Streptomyces thermoviolaceus]